MVHIFNGLILLILLSIIFYLINKNSYFKMTKYQYHYIIDKLMDTPYPTCLINLYTNKITMVNNNFIKLLHKQEISDLVDVDVFDSNIFTDYNDYINIKNNCQTDNGKTYNYNIVTNDNNGKKLIYKMTYNLIKIGFKKYMLLSVEDKTNLIEYIKRLGLFTKIADNNKDGIIVVNFKNRDGDQNVPIISYVNNSIGDITGYTINEIINKPLAILFETNVDDDTLLDLYDNLKKKKETTLEYQYIKKDGSICWIKTNMVPIIRQSILDKLIDIDTEKELEGLEKILDITDFDIYITLYQTDITEHKLNYELPAKTYMNKLSEYNRSVDKFFNVIDGLLNMPIISDINSVHRKEIIEQITAIVGQASDSDKCYIYKIIDDRMKLSYIWRADEFEYKDFNLIEGLTFEEAGLFKLYSNLIMNKSLYINSDIVKNNIYINQLFNMNDIKCSLIYPIMKNEVLIGFIGINSSEENKKWNDNVNKLMKMVSNKLADII